MENNIFKKLSMNSTVPEYSEKIQLGRPRYYRRKEDHVLENSPYVDISNKWAGGGFISTVEDLSKFGFAIISNQLLKTETIKLLITPQKLNDGTFTKYGLGWELPSDSHSQKLIISHSGAAEGCSSQLYIVPQDGLVIVVIANLFHAKGMLSLCNNIASLYAKRINEIK